MAENSSKLGDMTKSSLDSIKAMLDANTIIGDPIQTPVGTTIIPISKITVGYASGGIDYAKKDAPQNSHNNNFGGGFKDFTEAGVCQRMSGGEKTRFDCRKCFRGDDIFFRYFVVFHKYLCLLI